MKQLEISQDRRSEFIHQGAGPSIKRLRMSPSAQQPLIMPVTDSASIPHQTNTRHKEKTRGKGPTASYDNPTYRMGTSNMDMPSGSGTKHKHLGNGPPPVYTKTERISVQVDEKLTNEPPPPYTQKAGSTPQNGLLCIPENAPSQRLLAANDHKCSFIGHQGIAAPQVYKKNTPEKDSKIDPVGTDHAASYEIVKDFEREDSGGALFTIQRDSGTDNDVQYVEDMEACRLVSIEFDSSNDLHILQETDQQLRESRFYYPRMTSREAKKILNKRENGTFLIRDSTDCNYLYSLSVKTPRGTTSVRLLYERGMFSIDCDTQIKNEMPKFTSLLKLVHYYMKLSETSKSRKCVWLEQSGRKSEPVKILFPLVHGLPSLSHSCRQAINKNVPEKHIEELPLPEQMKQYIKENPITGKSHIM